MKIVTTKVVKIVKAKVVRCYTQVIIPLTVNELSLSPSFLPALGHTIIRSAHNTLDPAYQNTRIEVLYHSPMQTLDILSFGFSFKLLSIFLVLEQFVGSSIQQWKQFFLNIWITFK